MDREPEQEVTQETEKKKKKLSVRTVVGILIMLIGAGVFCYPLVVQAYNAREQKKMIAEIKAEILANMAEEEPTDAPVSPTTDPAVSPEATITEQPETEETEATKAPEEDSVLGGALTQVTEGPDVQDLEEENNSNRLNGRKVIGLIEIEAIDLFYPIVEGTETEDIGVAIGHMTETAAFGEIGNCALAGHRGGYSGPYFKNLDKLNIGDKVLITDSKGTEYVYLVTESMIVEPTEVWVVQDTGEGVAMLTLVTCEDNGTERLIVRCVME